MRLHQCPTEKAGRGGLAFEDAVASHRPCPLANRGKRRSLGLQLQKAPQRRTRRWRGADSNHQFRESRQRCPHVEFSVEPAELVDLFGDWALTFAAAAYDLVRLPKLIGDCKVNQAARLSVDFSIPQVQPMPRRQRGAFCAYSGTIPIQNMVLSPTLASYLRTKVSLPSSPMRNTVRPAGTVFTASPSLTFTGRLCSSKRPLGSM